MRSPVSGTTKEGRRPGQQPTPRTNLRRQPVLDDNLDKARRAVVSKAQHDFGPGVLAAVLAVLRAVNDEPFRAHPCGETSGNVVVVLGEQYANDVPP